MPRSRRMLTLYCKKNWLSLLLIGSLLLCFEPIHAGTNGIVDDALARAENDTTMALQLLAGDLLTLADDNAYLTRDLYVATSHVQLLETREKLTDPPWWEKVSNSSIVKVGLFLVGVEVGRRMVLVK